MKVGFTGTQHGMTDAQLSTFIVKLAELEMALGITEFHHGDCIGADDEAAQAAGELGIFRVSHPPIKQNKRAFSESEKTLEQKEYLERDRDIVDAVDVMFGTPREFTEQVRGGTWYTIRYAKKQGKILTIIYPDGTCE